MAVDYNVDLLVWCKFTTCISLLIDASNHVRLRMVHVMFSIITSHGCDLSHSSKKHQKFQCEIDMAVEA
jgi:hypothetical protein